MKIISLSIENFGKLSGYHLTLRPGVNTILEENGAGKTTLSHFIKAMFYGLPDSRKADLAENDRKRFSPWQGGTFGGSMIFESNGTVYRVERSFGQKASEDGFSVYDNKTGKRLEEDGELFGRRLFGIDADGFERTLFLSDRNLSGANDNRSIAEKLSDLVGTTGDIGAFDQAMSRLEEKRKLYQKKGGGGEIAQKRRQLAETEEEIARLAELSDDCERQVTRIEEKKAEIETIRKELASITEKIDRGTKESEACIHREQYRQYTEEALEKADIYNKCKEFFANKETTAEEIDRIRGLISEKSNLKKNLEIGYEAPDESLLAFRSTSREVIERIRALSEELEGDRRVAETLSRPAGAKAPKAPLCIAAAGGIFVLLGILTGILKSPIGFGFCGIGLVFFVIAFLAKKQITRENRIAEEAYTEAKERIASESERLGELLSAFPEREGDLCEQARRVIYAYEDYEKHGDDAHDPAEQMRRRTEDRLKVLDGEIAAFFEGFPVSGDQPIAQVDSAYRALTLAKRDYDAALERRTEYGLRHAVSESDAGAPDRTGEVREELDALRARFRDLNEEYHTAESDRAKLESVLSRCLSEVEALDAEKERKNELMRGIREDEEALRVILKTEEFLTAAKDRMNARYLGTTQKAFSSYLEKMDEPGGEFLFDTSFALSKTERGKLRPMETFSTGLRDLYALAARLALADALYGKDLPILLLDDPFAHFDDEHLKRAKAAISQLGGTHQVLYITCAKARTI